MKNRDFVTAAIGAVMMLIALHWTGAIEKPAIRTCDSVLREIHAIRACLAVQPICERVTVEQFIEHLKNKDWADANCPVWKGDDGPQS